MRYSIIVPVYNRPDEVDELLQSLCEQGSDSRGRISKTMQGCLR